ncbi:MAG: MgtC/SapB family protein [Chitinophagaceae bacterium]
MNEEMFIRLLLAGLWGGIVGAEREYRSKSAGFRTMIMISIGSCFFTMMSNSIGGTGNPDRIASNIVTGIGFLGAGVIFRGETRVTGITTAASIWTVAAVGMGIGAGYYVAAASASLLVLVVLAILPKLEIALDKWNLSRTYLIQCSFSETARTDYERLLEQCRLKYQLVKQVKTENSLSMTWEVQGNARYHEQFITTVEKDPAAKRFEY